MGQYYYAGITQKGKTVFYKNRSKNKATEQFTEWHGLKILEHSWWANDMVNGIAEKLFNKKGRVVWIGDYSDEGVCKASDGEQTPFTLESIEHYQECPTDTIEWKDCVINETDFSLKDMYIVNLSRKEYLDCNMYFEQSKQEQGRNKQIWCIHPLPLLTSTGGARGGGDYSINFPNQEYVGRWAYDELTIVRKKPNKKEYTLFNIYFKEERN